MGKEVKSATTFSSATFGLNLKNKLAQFLSNKGFLEMMSNSLTKSAQYNEEQLASAVSLLNPLSQDLNMLRIDLLPNMLEAMQYNNNRKNSDLRLFELGHTYHKWGNGEALSHYTENSYLAIGLYGKKQPESWNNAKTEWGYFSLKNLLLQVLSKVGLNQISYAFEADERFEQATQLKFKKKQIAVMGKIEPKLAATYDLDKAVWFACIDIKMLIELAASVKFSLKPISIFPAVRRDLALMLAKEVSYQQLEKIAMQTAPQLIKDMGVFDVYQGDKIEQGKKSYALNFTLQDEQKTLTDQEIDLVMKKLVQNFEKEVGAILRG
jgi:phenylalanyl-tRNA synthetase beta chain